MMWQQPTFRWLLINATNRSHLQRAPVCSLEMLKIADLVHSGKNTVCLIRGPTSETLMNRIEPNRYRPKLTMRQIDVLDGISRRKSIKQIAFELQISESAINQHIKTLKTNLKVGSLAGLAETYRSISILYEDSNCRKTASRKNRLPSAMECPDEKGRDGVEPIITFQEPLAYEMRAPWTAMVGPPVVPGVLNGKNASWVRGAAIIVIAVGILAVIMIGLGVAQGVTSALPRVHASPPMQRLVPAN